MKEIRISDMTMKQAEGGLCLTFKGKIELAKLLDRLGADVIELDAIQKAKIDSLLIKSVASAVEESTIAVPVGLSAESVELTWNALQEAKKPRLQVRAPVSPVGMEYLFHKKPDAVIAAVSETVAQCKKVCPDVEFIADDATRSDEAFLLNILSAAMEAGADTLTLCDGAGAMLPDEFAALLDGLYEKLPALRERTVGVCCSNTLAMADACAVAALRCGAGEIKTAAYPMNTASLQSIAQLLAAKGDSFGLATSLRVTQLRRIIKQIEHLCAAVRSKNSPFDQGVENGQSDSFLTAHDDPEAVAMAVARLGYDLSEEDKAAVYEAFVRIASKKEQVSDKELDAIVASAAMQVPPTYVLENYVIVSGNSISSTAHMKLQKHGVALEGVSIGDGPIDAAFLAIEQIIGCHFELDDFQIQSVTQGREAMGQTVVKLRSEGKVYSGCGISTDIVGASIRAYLSALNKISYEEAEA